MNESFVLRKGSTCTACARLNDKSKLGGKTLGVNGIFWAVTNQGGISEMCKISRSSALRAKGRNAAAELSSIALSPIQHAWVIRRINVKQRLSAASRIDVRQPTLTYDPMSQTKTKTDHAGDSHFTPDFIDFIGRSD